jgi:hypothetical protein
MFDEIHNCLIMQGKCTVVEEVVENNPKDDQLDVDADSVIS